MKRVSYSFCLWWKCRKKCKSFIDISGVAVDLQSSVWQGLSRSPSCVYLPLCLFTNENLLWNYNTPLDYHPPSSSKKISRWGPLVVIIVIRLGFAAAPLIIQLVVSRVTFSGGLKTEQEWKITTTTRMTHLITTIHRWQMVKRKHAERRH